MTNDEAKKMLDELFPDWMTKTASWIDGASKGIATLAERYISAAELQAASAKRHADAIEEAVGYARIVTGIYGHVNERKVGD